MRSHDLCGSSCYRLQLDTRLRLPPLELTTCPHFLPCYSRSVVPTTEDFDPALFMTVVHATASFNDIRNGLESLDGAKANQVRASAIFVLVNCVAPANGGSM